MTIGEAAQMTLRATGAVARRQALSRASRYVLLGLSLIGVAILVFLVVDTVDTGAGRLSWEFLTNYPSRFADRAGLRTPILGTIWVLTVTIVIALPIAIGTAIWMEEFAPRNRLLTLVQLNLANLAGVPSIIYGILGLTVFVRFAGLGPTILAGALTLALMIVPMTVIAAQEAIRQVPQSTRDGSIALGATRWQTVRHHVLPQATPGIMTGIILAVSRASGEAAALIMIGALAFIAFEPEGLLDSFTIVPIQIFAWTTDSRVEFRVNAAAAIIVLMVAVLALNLTAAVIRERFRRD